MHRNTRTSIGILMDEYVCVAMRVAVAERDAVNCITAIFARITLYTHAHVQIHFAISTRLKSILVFGSIAPNWERNGWIEVSSRK